MPDSQSQAPPPLADQPFPITFFDLGLMVLIALGLGLIFAAAILIPTLAGYRIDAIGDGQMLVFVATLVQSAVIVGAIWAIGMRRRRMSWRDMGFWPVPRRWYVVAALIALAGLPVISALTAGFQTLFDQPISSPQAGLLAPAGFTWFGAIGMLVMAGIVAPLAEELLFRGVLYRLLRQHWPVGPAAGASAMLFALMHGIVAVIPGTFVIGVVLALAYEKTGSLWICVTIHAVYNSLSLIVLFTMLGLGVKV